MPNMKPLSDFMEEYEKTRAVIKLMDALAKGEQSAKEKGWTNIADVERLLGVVNGCPTLSL